MIPLPMENSVKLRFLLPSKNTFLLFLFWITITTSLSARTLSLQQSHLNAFKGFISLRTTTFRSGTQKYEYSFRRRYYSSPLHFHHLRVHRSMTRHEANNDPYLENKNVSQFDETKKEMTTEKNDSSSDKQHEKYTPKTTKNNQFDIIQTYFVPAEGFQKNPIFDEIVNQTAKNEKRSTTLRLKYDNVTLPVALMALDPEEYPSLSRARKACRHRSILIHSGPLPIDPITGEPFFDSERCLGGKASTRIYPLDVIAKQCCMNGEFYPEMPYRKPSFDIPVVYEDDHFAIVNKPEGIPIYSHRKHGHRTHSIHAILPFRLKPPKPNTLSILHRPEPVHRLDKPTSGLLLVAKTKVAFLDLKRQFEERIIKKTYMGIVNGIPEERMENEISGIEAKKEIGVDVEEDSSRWQVIDEILDGKDAVTVWRVKKYVQSANAKQGVLTVVEMKPKTGRFHQLRRHMAWVCKCPLIGDSTYREDDTSSPFYHLDDLFLCSKKIVLHHPYFNTIAGLKEWEVMQQQKNNETKNYDENSGFFNATLKVSEEDGRTIEVHAEIDLPEKFDILIKMEQREDDRRMTIKTDEE